MVRIRPTAMGAASEQGDAQPLSIPLREQVELASGSAAFVR
jgi:hypothetical protein